MAFTQIGLGYLHHHDSEEENAAGYCFQEAENDACLGCSLHVIQELFYLDTFQCSFTIELQPDYSFERIKPASYVSFPATGRAPPTLIA